ncbi:MAG TPA: histidine phosphatase family protein [Patescibacteria group bacterium]|nr:histidine phosphatase family protein [Patescibacteria group bacterium]
MDIHTPKQLVLIRHGQSLLQEARPGRYFETQESKQKIKGLPDHRIELSREGLRQALSAGKKLPELFGEFDAIYHSGFMRAKQTAQALMASTGSDSRLLENILLNERDTGYTHGLTAAEVEIHFPYLSSYHESVGEFYFRFPGGESFADVCERARVWLTQIAVAYAGKNVCAVTHWGMIVAIRYNLESWDEDKFMRRVGTEEIGNCSATLFTYDADYYKLVYRNTEVLAQ